MTHRTLSERWYARCLLFYPKAHRDRFGDGMQTAFLADLEASRRGGAASVWAIWLRTVRDAVVLGSLERLGRVATGTRPMTGAGWKRQGWLFPFIADLRHAVRRLVRTPVFTVASVLTLALGIGATSSIYTVVHRVVLRPLPYPESDRLVKLDHRAPGVGLDDGLEMTAGLYVHYATRSRTLEDAAIYMTGETTLTGDDAAERLRSVVVTPSLFSTLGIPPHVGRLFDDADGVVDGSGVVILSHGLWTSRYGADPSLIGRTVRLDGAAYEVVGITPPGFSYPSNDIDVWVPRVFDPATTRFGGFNYEGIARLRQGVTVAEARADIDDLITRLPEAFPESDVARTIRDDAQLGSMLKPLRESMTVDIAGTLWVVLGTVGSVLLIACANVANLFLVRTEARQREVAVRTAIGAGRGQLVSYFLSESLVLGVVGGVVGLAVAVAGVEALVAFGPSDLPRLHEIAIDLNVIAVTVGASLMAGFAFGLLPILRLGPDVLPVLREGGRGTTSARGRFRARTALAVAQVAMALALLVGSALIVRSFAKLKAVDPGFEATGVLTFQVGLPRSTYRTPAEAVRFHREVLTQLVALPGVETAGAVVCRPLLRFCGGDPLYDPADPPPPGVIPPVVQHTRASDGYFETMRVPFLGGRAFSRADLDVGRNVAIVSRSLAERYWPGQDPVGRRVGPGGQEAESDLYTIIGLVEDVHTEGLATGRNEVIYLPLVSSTDNYPEPFTQWFMVRTAVPPLDMAATIRRTLAERDPSVAMAHTQTMEQVEAAARRQAAFTMALLVIAAAVGLALGAIGVYGVISYIVSQRQGEIGVRLALGARRGDVSWMVLRQGGVVAVLGMAVGLAVSLVAARAMRSVLFQVAPFDPTIYGAVSIVLLIVVLLASYLPARRAAAVDPVEALREG